MATPAPETPAVPGRLSPAALLTLCTGVAVVMIAQQVASKAVRDGFFLSHFDVSVLPVATLGGALVSFVAALAVGKFIASFTPAAAVPVLFAANGVLFLLEAVFAGRAPGVVAFALYFHTAAFGGAVVSGFWSVVNERFDPHTARTAVGRIAAGATGGGVVGGVATWWLSDLAAGWLLMGFGVSSLLCGLAVAWASAGADQGKVRRGPAGLLQGVEVLGQHAYPRLLGVLVLLVAFATDLVDYVFKSQVSAVTASGGLVGFFAIFYTVAGLVTFVLQSTASRRVLARVGAVPTVALFPGLALLLMLPALLSTSLVTLVLLRGGAMAMENSFYRSGYELLYTSMPHEQKRSTKPLIDVGVDRLGTAAASGTVMLLVALASAATARTLLLTSLSLFVAALAVLWVVRREHVAALAQQLRSAIEPRGEGRNDRAAARLLASTFVADVDVWQDSTTAGGSTGTSRSGAGAMDRETLLQQVHSLAEQKRQRHSDGERLVPRRRSVVSEALLDTPLRERLRQDELDPEQWAELRRTAPALMGQLGDIVVSARDALRVRMRAAELLSAVPSRRVVQALMAALASPQLRLRRVSALALLEVCRGREELVPERKRLVALAAAELNRPASALVRETPLELASPFVQDARGNELSAGVELVFVLLAVIGNPEELRLALTAITSEDPMQRGAGLEYLESLLPAGLRRRLLALAEHPERATVDVRVPQQTVLELASRLRAGELNLVQLRNKYALARRQQYDGQTRGSP